MTGVITAVKLKTQASVKGGFGFIRDAEGKDRFFHARDLQSDEPFELLGAIYLQIVQGKRPAVTFDPIEVALETGTGLRAQNVRLA